MENALYYLLSTVAQTFGAAAALLGALVLFRMQLLGQQAARAAEHLREHFRHSDQNELRKMYAYWLDGDFVRMIQQSKTYRDPTPEYERACATLTAVTARSAMLRRRFIQSLAITTLLVVVSIGAIPVVGAKWLTDFWGSVAFAGSLLAIVAIALYIYWRTMLDAIGGSLSPG